MAPIVVCPQCERTYPRPDSERGVFRCRDCGTVIGANAEADEDLSAALERALAARETAEQQVRTQKIAKKRAHPQHSPATRRESREVLLQSLPWITRFTAWLHGGAFRLFAGKCEKCGTAMYKQQRASRSPQGYFIPTTYLCPNCDSGKCMCRGCKEKGLIVISFSQSLTTRKTIARVGFLCARHAVPALNVVLVQNVLTPLLWWAVAIVALYVGIHYGVVAGWTTFAVGLAIYLGLRCFTAAHAEFTIGLEESFD